MPSTSKVEAHELDQGTLDPDSANPTHGPKATMPKIDNVPPSQKDILDDIDGHIYPDIPDLFAKFFTARPWTATTERFLQHRESNRIHDQDRLQSVENLTIWLAWVTTNLAKHGESQYNGCSWRTKVLEESEHDDRVIVLAKPQEDNENIDWADVMVLGKVHQHGSYQEGFLQLCGHARSIFASQTARIFLHGFYTFENQVELCMFDRSGVYVSPQLDTTRNSDPFSLAIVGYTLMDDEELGLSPLVKRDANGVEFVEVVRDDDGSTEPRRFYLYERIYERSDDDLVGDGIRVYRARPSTSERCEYAIKFKWTTTVDENEFKMLELAQERGVSGVLRLEHHIVGTNTNALHQGLTLGAQRKMQLASQGSVGSREEFAAQTLETEGTRKNDVKEFHCTITTPLGRSLHRYDSVLEALQALADAVKAHRSLYLDGKILHKDISPANIIIPDNTADGKLKGWLIDLDLAVETCEPYVPFKASGTYIFKAIGVLRAYLPDNPHTYRHDLESFFYVFLFLAICPRPVIPPKTRLQLPENSVMRRWYEGRPFDRANCVTGDMSDSERFGRILAEFTPDFKKLSGLAEKLRAILFPIRDDKMWMGTDMTAEGTNALYDQIVNAFETAALDQAKL